MTLFQNTWYIDVEQTVHKILSLESSHWCKYKFHSSCFMQSWYNQDLCTSACTHLLASHLCLNRCLILALRNLVLLLWDFNLYCRLVIKCCGSQHFSSACIDLICICKQNESSLALVSSWSYSGPSVEYPSNHQLVGLWVSWPFLVCRFLFLLESQMTEMP